MQTAGRSGPTVAIVGGGIGGLTMQIAEERAPDGFKRIEDVIPRAELEEISARYKRAAGFDRGTLNRSTVRG